MLLLNSDKYHTFCNPKAIAADPTRPKSLFKINFRETFFRISEYFLFLRYSSRNTFFVIGNMSGEIPPAKKICEGNNFNAVSLTNLP